ncbi:hypothetical protein [Lyngbya confervoides]|uniref:Uncharacterized protein n=1 Tax=Lyngbya confervoides BDU141951 TaxID=1574623 RepID=A0ABD4T5V5_9CYAN|nr:hypothetical protein [Lyngbya confervoides]MCM1983932.1 hypothetical protein [Lyngbya confervoides BDU141951]
MSLTESLAQAGHLRQQVLDALLEAEGTAAVALETYSAQKMAQLSQSAYKGSDRTEFVLDQFLTAGRIDGQSPLDWYLSQHAELSAQARSQIQSWQQGFLGLFQVMDQRNNLTFEVMNWLTAKRYALGVFPAQSPARPLQVGEVIQGHLVPLDSTLWMFTGPQLRLGKLGEAKLAVVIGSFRQNHGEFLYGDAPDLLAAAWASVERSHQSFMDFFGGPVVTLSGAQLHRQLEDFQAHLAQQQIDASGLDGSKTLQDLSAEAGQSTHEVTSRLAALGLDAQASERLISERSLAQMMRPTLELPPSLRHAPQVTVITDARGGQVFLENYQALCQTLAQIDQTPPDQLQTLAQAYLSDPNFKPFVWQQLAEARPEALEQFLRRGLNQPQFELHRDLASLLAQSWDDLRPQLPETASVPLHLHELFQRAVAKVGAPAASKQSRNKRPSRSKGGFG